MNFGQEGYDDDTDSDTNETASSPSNDVTTDTQAPILPEFNVAGGCGANISIFLLSLITAICAMFCLKLKRMRNNTD